MNFTKRLSWRRCELTPRDRHNQQRALLWLFIWALSWVLANVAIKEGLASIGIAAAAVTLLSALLGVVTLLAYWTFIREADELQRKIQLEGLALGFGVGLVGAFTIHLLVRTGMMTAIDPSDVAALMMIAYAVAVVVRERRYA